MDLLKDEIGEDRLNELVKKTRPPLPLAGDHSPEEIEQHYMLFVGLILGSNLQSWSGLEEVVEPASVVSAMAKAARDVDRRFLQFAETPKGVWGLAGGAE